jgi:hypothetical protein
MAKLFVFAIGGTGSRVLRSLAMLMACGVELHNTDTVIPIVIDFDIFNGDKLRTLETLKTYKNIRDKSFSDNSNFFKINLSFLDDFFEGKYVPHEFKFESKVGKKQSFKEFIGYNELDRNNKAITSMLFSEEDLDNNIEIGMTGNSSIGSVVLNTFKDSPFFIKFASNFDKNDRIFIISSIFGGSGAAGFPLILKNIRDAKNPIPHSHLLQNAKIGAVAILPYFNINRTDNLSIDSNQFISKAKIALSYYAKNVSDSNSINALYYIGEKETTKQKETEGSLGQKNNAHFIEMAAALSIVDFMSLSDNDLNVENGKAVSPMVLEFGIRNKSSSIIFSDLADKTREIIAKPLIRYSLFRSFMDNHYKKFSTVRGEAWASHGKNKLIPKFIDRKFLNSLNQFNKDFAEWLDEMSVSSVSFAPIDTSKSGKDIYNLVRGMANKKEMLKNFFRTSGINNYLGILSRFEPSFDHLKSDKKLMALFSKATNEITNKELEI